MTSTDQPEISSPKCVADTILWFERVVLGLNLCPFAHSPWRKQQVYFTVCEASDLDGVLKVFVEQVLALMALSIDERETTVLVIEQGFDDFDDYLGLLELANELIALNGWEGEIQVASFHPDYVFEGTDFNARENFSNRSPFPLLHILREDSIEKAVAMHPDIDDVPRCNIDLLNNMDETEFERTFKLNR